MSSTGRGGVRQPDDFYRTPAWATRAILQQLAGMGQPRVLDPACGDGAILDVVREEWPTSRRIGFELDAERARTASALHSVIECDALARSAKAWVCADVIVMNPPFSLAMPFIERAIGCIAVVAALLRLNFLGSQKRAAWHRANPSDVYVLPKRPAFTADGKTDSCEYAWFVWGAGRGGRWSVLEVEA